MTEATRSQPVHHQHLQRPHVRGAERAPVRDQVPGAPRHEPQGDGGGREGTCGEHPPQGESPPLRWGLSQRARGGGEVDQRAGRRQRGRRAAAARPRRAEGDVRAHGDDDEAGSGAHSHWGEGVGVRILGNREVPARTRVVDANDWIWPGTQWHTGCQGPCHTTRSWTELE
eukprot:gene1987-biopygen5674